MLRTRYAAIFGKSRRMIKFPGLDTPRFHDVFGHRIFPATEKVRFGENTVPDTSRVISTTPPDFSVFSTNTAPYRVIYGPRHAPLNAVQGVSKSSTALQAADSPGHTQKIVTALRAVGSSGHAQILSQLSGLPAHQVILKKLSQLPRLLALQAILKKNPALRAAGYPGHTQIYITLQTL